MTPALKILTSLSFLGILAICIYRVIKYRQWRSFTLQIIVLAISFGLIYHFFYRLAVPTARGEGNDIYFVIVLYVFMVLGMAAHYVYTRLEHPETARPPFDFGLFIAPVFASPIIFIPLVSALQNANIDLRSLTTPKLMVFLVAFENGFFWKEYFDNRRKSILEGSKHDKANK